jgi:uncharacterized membrane protein
MKSNSEKIDWKENNPFPIIITLLLLVVFCIVAVITNAIGFFDIPASFLGAALGAVITALVTLLLLNGQTKAEEKKVKNVRIFELKKDVYTKYINKVWDCWADQHIDEKEFEALCSDYYKDIAIYLEDKDKRKDFVDYLIKIGECLGKEEGENYDTIKENVFFIIGILVEDLELGGKVDKDQHDRLAETLFPGFFKKAIATEITKVLQDKHSCFSEGKYGYVHYEDNQFLYFDINTMKKAGGNFAKLIIGPFIGKAGYNEAGQIGINLFYEKDWENWPNDENMSSLYDYRAGESGWWRRILRFNGDVYMLSICDPIDEEDKEVKAKGEKYIINFANEAELKKKHLTNYQKVSKILAYRVGKVIEQEKIDLKAKDLDGKEPKALSIIEFLKHMKLIE